MGSPIPNTWKQVPISQIAHINPELPLQHIPDTFRLTFLPMKSVAEEINRIDTTEIKPYSEVKKGYTPIAEGDVLFAKITPCMENGKAAIAKGLHQGLAFGSTEFFVLRCTGAIHNSFLYHFLASKNTRQTAAAHMTGAVGQKRVPRKFLEEFLIPLPPLAEQSRIVAKIEELFSSLDKGVESLKTAKEQLKVYRQAVLKWAFEGKPIRRPLLEFAQIQRGRSRHRPRDAKELYGGKYPFIQTGDVRAANGGTIYEYSQTYSALGLSQSKLWPRGTLCLTIAANIADTAFLGFDACFPDSVVGITSDPEILSLRYLNYYIRMIKQTIDAGASATAQKNINVEYLEKLEVPIIPIQQQEGAVSFIESRFSTCDKLEEAINQGLAQAEALRQSILKKAFEGKLVPQDPNDEPASVLLERIRAERAAEEHKKPARKNAARAVDSSARQGTSRRPGRPRKVEPASSEPARRGPGRPRKNKESSS